MIDLKRYKITITVTTRDSAFDTKIGDPIWHLLDIENGDRYDMCLNPVLSENLVTGKVKGGRFCDMMRRTYGGCGVNGEYWEARK